MSDEEEGKIDERPRDILSQADDVQVTLTAGLAAAAVFGTAELLEAILAGIELKQLHVLQRVSSTFKNIINTSPTLKSIAHGRYGFPPESKHGSRRGNLHVHTKTFVVCNKGSTIHLGSHPYYHHLKADVNLLAFSQSERVRGLWDGMLLEDPDKTYTFNVGRRNSADRYKISLGRGGTLGDLIDAVVEAIKKDMGVS